MSATKIQELKPTKQINKILREIAKECDYDYSSFSDDWIVQLKHKDKIQYLYGFQFQNNNGAVKEICNDKSATSNVLESGNVPMVEHFFFRKISSTATEEKIEHIKSKMEILLDKYKTLVVKRNSGSGGGGTYIARNKEELWTCVNKVFRSNPSLSISPYYDILHEYRVVVANKELRLFYEKIRPTIVGNGKETIEELLKSSNTNCKHCSTLDLTKVPKKGEIILLNWKHNLGQGAKPREIMDKNLKNKLKEICNKVFAILDLQVGAIDIIDVGEDLKVLEINSGLMMESFSKENEKNYVKAKQIYKDVVQKNF